ncbi:glycosyltransferase [Burkholderia ubonensis]|uniref:glycosyltransferase n=1 Tax=Burkholderia ubonensis TaxID=101571 RepID=UPI000754C76F|nr:glycosyltransferase [Burkholderia ubonensis]KVC71768.1 hypothetical protein WI75_25645 [Burkholderia ubonensis]
MPFFTIAIVTRNYGHFIEQAIRSCLVSTDQDVEILVIDDGSNDDTALIVQSIREHHPNGKGLRYYNVGQIGSAAARNESLRLARGTYLVCLDADDVLMPDTLARYRQILEVQPDVDVLYGHVIATYPDLVPAFRMGVDTVPAYPDSVVRLLSQNPLPHAGTACRIQLMRAVGGYRVDLNRGEDYAMWLDLAIHRARFSYLDACVALYRRHDANATAHYSPAWDLPVLSAMLERYAMRDLLPSLDWHGNEVTAQRQAAELMAQRLRQAGASDECVQACLAPHLQRASHGGDPGGEGIAPQSSEFA